MEMMTFILSLWIFHLQLDIFLTLEGEIYEPILSTKVLFESQPFSLQCYGTSFDIEDKTKEIQELRLEKLNNVTQQFDILAINAPSLHSCTVIDQRWKHADIAFTRFGSTHCDEKATGWNISITLVTRDPNALCLDTGWYRCVATTIDNTSYISTQEYLTVLGKPKILAYKVIPCETRPYCLATKFMCIAEGPEPMSVKWKYKEMKVVEPVDESKTVVNRTDCINTLFTITLNMTIQEKYFHTMPVCYVTYAGVMTDERSSELVDDGAIVSSTTMKLNSKLTITCSQKWFHVADYSLSKLLVTRKRNMELWQITFLNDSHYLNNETKTKLSDGWMGERKKIYGNVNLILTKAGVTCRDSGIYQCIAIFISGIHIRELVRSVVIDVGVELNNENKPEITISECRNDSVCCVEKGTLIHLTCSVNSSVETDPDLACTPLEGNSKTLLSLPTQKLKKPHEVMACHQGKIVNSIKNVSIQTSQLCSCQLLSRKSRVIVNISPSYPSNPLLHVSPCLSQHNCLVFQHSKIEVTCFKNGSKNNPMAMYYITDTNEVPISKFPFAINVSYVARKIYPLQTCTNYLHEYRVTIYSLAISARFKCEQHQWSSYVSVSVIKQSHKGLNKDSLSIFWLTPIILGPMSLAIIAGVMHVVFLKSSLNAIVVENTETRKHSAATNDEEYNIFPQESSRSDRNRRY